MHSWKEVQNLDEAKALVDQGILLTWKETKTVKKVLALPEQQELIRYFAVRLAERTEFRLPEEILVESLLVLLANSQEEVLLVSFLEELVQQPNQTEACETLVELAITSEISDQEHHDDIFSIAVALICELGNLLQEVKKQYGDQLSFDPQRILDHISTYLLSVSNSSNNCIRLSLVHYFGNLEKGLSQKPGFNRIMGRFGYTVLEHLFTLLFNKKTEAVALQFLLENTPAILEGDNHCQKILHETWKFYMLKKPERFALFIQTLTRFLASQPHESHMVARKVFMQHLAVLLKIVSEVNHKELGREIMSAIGSFSQDSFRNEILDILSKDKSLRENYRLLVTKILNCENADQVLDEADGFRSSKRGRKPSFAKANKTKPIYQATFLGHQTTAKAS